MDLIWTETAKNDLEQIYRYIARDSIEYADLLISNIINRGEALRKFKNLGRTVPEVGLKEFRELLSQNYRIIYHLNLDTIEILTLLHTSQQFKL